MASSAAAGEGGEGTATVQGCAAVATEVEAAGAKVLDSGGVVIARVPA
jgi:hypothetical protein